MKNLILVLTTVTALAAAAPTIPRTWPVDAIGQRDGLKPLDTDTKLGYIVPKTRKIPGWPDVLVSPPETPRAGWKPADAPAQPETPGNPDVPNGPSSPSETPGWTPAEPPAQPETPGWKPPTDPTVQPSSPDVPKEVPGKRDSAEWKTADPTVKPGNGQPGNGKPEKPSKPDTLPDDPVTQPDYHHWDASAIPAW
ncbi:hypothetical protein CSOJ01_14558 [Colletotrichum sojae]|uniref:Uncharacterized protein n=1 Tax=Colletotrichum sojae TaxID=2175907 RepID=A0A8H6IPQ4_9PEZI|nr:hypothetical protein CSOJ01_14558 [Colletotrichum sojae]